MAHHRSTPKGTVLDAQGVLRRNGLLLAVANLSAATGMVIDLPGTSPGLALVAPLPVWAAPFTVAGVLQIVKRPLAGHTVGVLPWLMLALGVVLGLVQGMSRSPSASIIFAGLVLYCAGHHINAMVFRRQEALTRTARR